MRLAYCRHRAGGQRSSFWGSALKRWGVSVEVGLWFRVEHGFRVSGLGFRVKGGNLRAHDQIDFGHAPQQ